MALLRDWSLPVRTSWLALSAAAAIVLGDLAVFLHWQVDRRLLRRASSWGSRRCWCSG